MATSFNRGAATPASFDTDVLPLLAGTLFALLAFAPSSSAAPVVVGDITFDSSAFADVVLADSGTITPDDIFEMPTLEAAMTGSDLDSYFDPDPDDWVQVGFVDNAIVNGPGDDLAVFEMLSAEDPITIRMIVAGMDVVVPTTDTGLVNTNGNQINVGFLDLADFGLADNANVNDLFVFGTGLPEVAALGAINNRIVPEPATLTMTGLALIGLLRRRRRRYRPWIVGFKRVASEGSPQMHSVCSLLVFISVSIAMVGGANAGSILWDFEGSVSAITDDPLGINGEVIGLHLEFDDSDVWVEGDNSGGVTSLHFPTAVSSASITGAHTIETNSVAPSARFIGGFGGISESLNNRSYVDFVIDGELLVTFGPNGPEVLAPSVGENLQIAHLRDDPGQFAAMVLPSSGERVYEFTNQSLTIIPEPSTWLLLASALAAFGSLHGRIPNESPE